MTKADTGAPLYVRRDVWQLSAQPWHPVIEWYARAIRILQSRDGTTFADPTSWRHLAEIHGSSTPPGSRPRGARWNQCEHGSWFFLPWHRIYLHHFEKIVRQVVIDAGGPADWALPFWDYSDPARPETRMLPPAFREARMPSGQPNPLRVDERGPLMNINGELSQTAVGIDAAFAETSFTETGGGGASGGFGGAIGPKAHLGQTPGALEVGPHGHVHMGVGGSEPPGGWMSGFNTAGRDPIFWLHHANIDRLWDVWVRTGRRNPTEAPWLGERFVFGSGAAVTDLSVADVLDTTAPPLRYTFGPVSTQPPAVVLQIPTEAPMRDRSPKVAGTSETPVPLTDESSTAELRVTLPPDHGLESIASEEGRRIFLRLDGVRGNRLAAGSFLVYLNLPKGATPADYPQRRVGQISMFGVRESSRPDAEHSSGEGLSFSFDITQPVRQLQATREWQPDRLHVTFAPVPDSAGKVYPGADVQVGRLSVYYV